MGRRHRNVCGQGWTFPGEKVRGREREALMAQRSPDPWPPVCFRTGDETCSLGVCPDRGSRLRASAACHGVHWNPKTVILGVQQVGTSDAIAVCRGKASADLLQRPLTAGGTEEPASGKDPGLEGSLRK